jgi:hypothetical protein
MQTVEREAGFLEVVEIGCVERSDVGVTTGVLDVAHHAVIGDVAVDSALGGDALGHRFVAAQTLLGGDALARFVALLAVGDAFELCVRLAQGAW